MPPSRRLAQRAGVVLALLCAEYIAMFLWLARLHDGDALTRLPAIWEMALRYGSLLAGGGAAAMIAALAMRRRDLAPAQALVAGTARSGQDALLWGVAHGATLTIFFLILMRVLDSSALAQSGGAGLLFAWLAGGVASVVALLRCAIGPSFFPAVRSLAPIFATAALIGGLGALGAVVLLPQWPLLAVPTLHMSAALLDLCCGAVTSLPDEALIRFGEFSVFVDKTCSGIEGMALVTAILGCYLAVFRDELRFPRALLLLPAGALVSFLVNALRIAALLYIGDRVSPELAKGSFHSMAGWIFFSCVSIGIMLGAQQLRWIHRAPARGAVARPSHAPADPATVHLLPFMLWLALGLLTAALTLSEADPLYPLRVVVLAGLLWALRHRLPGLGPAVGLPGAPRALLGATALGLGVAVIWVALAPDTAPAGRQMPEALRLMPPVLLGLWVVARLVGTVVIVPIIEELAFRGYLQRFLVSRDFSEVPQGKVTPLAVAVSALAFGLMHSAVLAGVIAGVAFTAATLLRGRISDAILAHAVANAALSALVLLAGRWDLW